MNYQLHYDRLISTRKTRVLETDVRYEIHHIRMKCMGGDESEENLIKLTFKEHILAHRLLWMIFRNHENHEYRKYAAYAYHCMSWKGKGRNGVHSPRSYAEAKNAIAEATGSEIKRKIAATWKKFENDGKAFRAFVKEEGKKEKERQRILTEINRNLAKIERERREAVKEWRKLEKERKLSERSLLHDTDKEYPYTAEEMMKMFDIDKQELYQWRKSGSVKFKKMNSRVFMYSTKPKEVNDSPQFPRYKSQSLPPVHTLKISETNVWYTADDIMSLFNISKQVLRNWRLTGKIEFEKFNARVFRYKFPKL